MLIILKFFKTSKTIHVIYGAGFRFNVFCGSWLGFDYTNIILLSTKFYRKTKLSILEYIHYNL